MTKKNKIKNNSAILIKLPRELHILIKKYFKKQGLTINSWVRQAFIKLVYPDLDDVAKTKLFMRLSKKDKLRLLSEQEGEGINKNVFDSENNT